VEFSKEMERILEKLYRRNRKQFDIITDKIKEIRENPYHYKPLRHDMKGFRRVHIDKSFVLVFKIMEETKTVKIEDFDHHDNIYRH
jgi:YafQ family addiction module toxin component